MNSNRFVKYPYVGIRSPYTGEMLITDDDHDADAVLREHAREIGASK